MPTPWLPFSSPSKNMWGFQVGSRQERLRSWERVVGIPGYARVSPQLSLKCLASHKIIQTSHKIDSDEIKWVPERDGNSPNTPQRWWCDNLRSRWQWGRQAPGLTMTRKCTHDDDGTTYYPMRRALDGLYTDDEQRRHPHEWIWERGLEIRRVSIPRYVFLDIFFLLLF